MNHHPAFAADVTSGNITEYIVDVVGRGYVERTIPVVVLSGTPLVVFDYDEADDLAKTVKAFFTRLNCPEIARDVQIMSRTVHVEKTDWKTTIRVATST